MEMKKFELNDRVYLRKKHPCGSHEWKIIRVGMDIRIECLGCRRRVMLPRQKFERMVKKIMRDEEGD